MIHELMLALKAIIETEFTHPLFINDQDPESLAGVKVHIVALPFKRGTPSQNDFPFILIQPIDGTDAAGSSTMTVRIHCGVFNNEVDNIAVAGENDLVNMIERVRRCLRASQFIGDGHLYQLVLPIKWRIGDPENDHFQPLPQNEGVVTTTWSIPGPHDVPVDAVLAAIGN